MEADQAIGLRGGARRSARSGWAAMRLAAAGLALVSGASDAQARPLVPEATLESVVAIAPRSAGAGAGAVGSGVVIGHNGLIATMRGALGGEGPIEIRLADGRRAPAERLAEDPRSGLVLLRAAIAPPPAPEAAPEPPIASPVCAVGASVGGLAVSCGALSARHVSGLGAAADTASGRVIEDFLQIDAGLAPSAVGGGLFDEQGRLLGLIARPSEARANGAALASPAPLALRVAEALAAGAPALYGDPGWRLAPLDARLSAQVAGAAIAEIAPGGAAARAGLKRGDVLMEVAGRTLRAPADAAASLARLAPGESFNVAILREGRRQTKQIAPQPGAAPARSGAVATRLVAARPAAAAPAIDFGRREATPTAPAPAAEAEEVEEDEGSFWDFLPFF